jgi:hypothetical protein
MFGTKTAIESVQVDPVQPEPPRGAGPIETVPLSVLKLDLDPGEDWATFLGRRAIAIVPDALGRDSIGHDAARRLLDERRADELRQRKLAALRQEEEEADKLRRAQIWGGVPATAFPDGVSAASVMLTAAQDARPRRQSPLQHALANSGELVFHSLAEHDADEE